MTPKCFQTLDNGQRCSALAIHGSKFCRHHNAQRAARPAQEKASDTESLNLPQVLDRASALAALNMVVQALSDGRTKRSVAQTLLSAIKFGAQLIKEMAEAGETVRPVASYSQPRSIALAASGDRPRTEAFNPALRYPEPASASGVDPATARMLKEILSQSHELATTRQNAGI